MLLLLLLKANGQAQSKVKANYSTTTNLTYSQWNFNTPLPEKEIIRIFAVYLNIKLTKKECQYNMYSMFGGLTLEAAVNNFVKEKYVAQTISNVGNRELLNKLNITMMLLGNDKMNTELNDFYEKFTNISVVSNGKLMPMRDLLQIRYKEEIAEIVKSTFNNQPSSNNSIVVYLVGQQVCIYDKNGYLEARGIVTSWNKDNAYNVSVKITWIKYGYSGSGNYGYCYHGGNQIRYGYEYNINTDDDDGKVIGCSN